MPLNGKIGAPPATAAQGTLLRFTASEQLIHHHTVDSLGCSVRHRHDGCSRITVEGLEQFHVFQISRSTQHHIFLEFIQLPLRGLQVPDNFHKRLVVLVQDAKLLVQTMEIVLDVRGCCWRLSPAITTSGRQLRQFRVPAHHVEGRRGH